MPKKKKASLRGMALADRRWGTSSSSAGPLASINLDEDDDDDIELMEGDVGADLAVDGWLNLSYSSSAETSLRQPYRGSSRATQYRKKAKADELNLAARDIPKITSWFGPVAAGQQRGAGAVTDKGAADVEEGAEEEEEVLPAPQQTFASLARSFTEGAAHGKLADADSDYEDVDEDLYAVDRQKLAEKVAAALEFLSELGLDAYVQNERKRQNMLAFLDEIDGNPERELVRLLAVRSYLINLQQPGMSVRQAAGLVARHRFDKAAAETSSVARSIRKWGSFFMDNFSLPPSFQGRHVKNKCFLEEGDVAQVLNTFIRAELERDTNGFNHMLLISFVRATYGRTICENTALDWMDRLGFEQKERGKGLYFDGHERPDVIAYRLDFVERVNKLYLSRMESCVDNEDGGIEIQQPNLSAVQQHQPPALQRLLIPLAHDECTFYSKDGKRRSRVIKGTAAPMHKGKGKSLMVSGFICPCHGFFCIEHAPNPAAHPELAGAKSYVLFEAGKGREGWWRNEDLVAQTEKVIQLFEAVHPGCQALFIFDNSQNHHKKSPTSIDPSEMTVKDGGKNASRLARTGWYMEDGVSVPQNMYLEDGTPKGLKTILSERGLFTPGMKRKDMQELLEKQPDVLEQKEWLSEVVTSKGHLIDYFPKYHCELNPIERVWGRAKATTRKSCDYTLPTLRGAVPKALQDISVSTIRRFFRHAFRYMDAYRPRSGRTLTMVQAAFAVKKYTSHRCIPDEVFVGL